MKKLIALVAVGSLFLFTIGCSGSSGVTKTTSKSTGAAGSGTSTSTARK